MREECAQREGEAALGATWLLEDERGARAAATNEATRAPPPQPSTGGGLACSSMRLTVPRPNDEREPLCDFERLCMFEEGGGRLV